MAILPRSIADFGDKVATGLDLPVYGSGFFERLSGGQNLTFTGSTPYQREAERRIQSNPQPTPTGNVLDIQAPPDTYGAPDQSGGGGFPQPIAPNQNLGDQNLLGLIEQQYNQLNSSLDQSASATNTNFSNTESAINSERDTSLGEAEGQRGIRGTELDNQAAQGRATERKGLGQVRQLLSDLDQRNAARVAVTGGGSSSDALAERFGRTAQQSSGAIVEEGQRLQNDIGVERSRVNLFYDTVTQRIKDAATAAVNEARQVRDSTLGAIEQARGQSAAAKAQANYDAWSNFYNAVNQANLQAANFQSQYDSWFQNKSAQLDSAYGFNLNPINPVNTAPGVGMAASATVPGIGGNAGGTQALNNFYFNPNRNPEEDQQTYA